MGVRTYNLDKNPIIRGADWKFVVNYLDDDGSTPVNLAGCTARLRVRRSGDGDLIWEATISVGTGTITVGLTGEETDALNFTRAIYLLDVVFPSETRTILTGTIETK